MPQVDLILETYVHAPVAVVAPRIAESGLARRLWPRWTVVVADDRGEEGIRWTLDDPRVIGSTEIWVERRPDGTGLLHTFVRVDRRGRPWPRWRVPAVNRRLRASMSVVLWDFKDELEGVDRPAAAVPPRGRPGRGVAAAG